MSFVPADYWPPGPPTGGAAVDQTARDAAAAAQSTATAAVSTGAELTTLLADPSSKMDFSRGLPGATTRTVQDKVADVVSVRDFGAKCDGVKFLAAASGAAGQPVLAINGASASKAPPVAGQRIWVQGGGTASSYPAAGTMALNSFSLVVTGQTFTHARTWNVVRVKDGVAAGTDLVTLALYVPNGWNTGGNTLTLLAKCTNPAGVAGVDVTVSPHLSTTISSVSGNNVTMGANLGTAVAAADVLWGTNDTAAWQAANTAMAALYAATGHQAIIRGVPGTISVMGSATNKNYNGAFIFYGCKISSGVTIDGAGMRVCAVDATSFMPFTNDIATPTGNTDHDIGLNNIVIDKLYQPDAGTALGLGFFGVTNLTTNNLSIVNSMRVGAQMALITNHAADELRAQDCIGAGLILGLNNAVNTNPRLGTIYAYNIYGLTSGGSLAGNTVVTSFVGGTGAAVLGGNADAAHKYTDGSNFALALSVFIASAGTSGNSGSKIQGSVNAQSMQRITIGQVISVGCYGMGLFVNNCTACGIGIYSGQGNGIGSGFADIQLDINMDRFTIASADSDGAGLYGLSTAATHVRTEIGRLTIRNPATNGAQAAINHGGGALLIDNLNCVDDRGGSALMTRAITAAAAVVLKVKQARIVGWTSLPFTLPTTVNGSYVARAVFDDAFSPDGTFAPTASATTVVVANNNVRAVGAFIVPIITVRAMNATAQTLMAKPIRYTYTTNSITFILPSAAVGTEVFYYEIERWGYSATNFT